MVHETAQAVLVADASGAGDTSAYFARTARLVSCGIALFVTSRALDFEPLFRGASALDFAQAQSLFAWHPICMALGMLWLFTEAWLAIRARRGLKGAERLFQVKLHFVLVTLATLLGSLGFRAIYANKANAGKPHFTSYHGKAGLAAMVLMWCNFLHGVFVRGGGGGAAAPSWFQWRSSLHRTLGTVAFFVSLLAVGLGLVSGWGMAKLQGFQTPNANAPTIAPFVLALLVAVAGLCALLFDPSTDAAHAPADTAPGARKKSD